MFNPNGERTVRHRYAQPRDELPLPPRSAGVTFPSPTGPVEYPSI